MFLRPLLISAIALGVVSLIGASSLALFTDTAQIQNSTFTTGTVDLDLSDSNETNADDLATSDLTLSAMAPGDQVQPDNGITARNNGSLNLRYALYAKATDADSKHLKDQLEITIREPDTSGANSGESPVLQCNDFDGTAIYGATTNFDGSAVADTYVAIFGDSVSGAHAGDRALTASASEVLCFRVKLATTAPNSVQGATTTLTFEFRAEQTKNN